MVVGKLRITTFCREEIYAYYICIMPAAGRYLKGRI